MIRKIRFYGLPMRDSDRKHPVMNSLTHHQPHDEHDDDMTAECLTIMGISLAATYISAGGDPSRMAIPGAMLAALVALFKAAQEKRGWQEKAANSIGISVVGSTAPPAIIQYFWPDTMQRLGWQALALLGFLGGLVGWSLAYAFVKAVGLRSDRLADLTLDKWEPRITGSRREDEERKE